MKKEETIELNKMEAYLVKRCVENKMDELSNKYESLVLDTVLPPLLSLDEKLRIYLVKK